MAERRRSSRCCSFCKEVVSRAVSQPRPPSLPYRDAFAWLENSIRSCYNPEVARPWIHCAEDINAAFPNTGMTPLELALESCNAPVIRMLLDNGAMVDLRLKYGVSPVVCACARGYLTGVKLLVAHGADFRARFSQGLTCLLVAARNKHFAVVSYLLQLGYCGVSEVDDKGYSALHYASIHNHPSTVSNLIQNGAVIDAQSRANETPVFLATKKSCWDSLRALLESGADPNICAKRGESALRIAVKRGNTEAVAMLLKHGADRARATRDGSTPFDLAMQLDPPNLDIIDALLHDSQVKLKEEEEDIKLKMDVAEQRLENLERAAEQCLYCPITFEVMKDPVLAQDGHTYERKAIEEWLRQKRESPVTRQPLTSRVLIPNLAVKHLISQRAVSPEDV